MICYIDQDGYLMSYTPIEGGIEVDAPEEKFLTSQHRLINGQWIVSDVTPQRVLREIEAMQAQRAAVLGDAVRAKRNELLTASDWTDTLSAKARLGDVMYDAWQDYRQILRDVPQQAGFPTEIAWPEPPSPT